MNIQNYISNILNISAEQVASTLTLFEEGGTIPFISRYRKERTGNLDEVQIAGIQKHRDEFLNIEKRKVSILSSIEEQGSLTESLKAKIESSFDLIEIEDLYLPYKSKRKTKATIAKDNGLEPLAKIIMSQNNIDIIARAQGFVNKNIKDPKSAIAGAIDIISEWINENISTRNYLRRQFERKSILTTKKGKEPDQSGKYKDYYEWEEPLYRCSSHRFLAIYRGNNEGILKMHALPDEELVLDAMNQYYVKNNNDLGSIVKDAVKNAYRKLLRPSLENERIQIAKAKADRHAINVFKENLRQLLMTPPLGSHRTMGIDPGFRSGCKVVVLDEKGDLLNNTNIYPHKPQEDFKTASECIVSFVDQYQIDTIAIGNGTASRETESFIKKLKFNRPVGIFVVSEDGASIYSASKVGREEFPEYDLTVRGAVSIGRRLMDPLSELVKIDPQSLGVGQYQHEVDQKELKESLDFVVESVVNLIGVNINIASRYLLQYVAGLNMGTAQKIVKYREDNGVFTKRKDLLKVPGIGPKAFEQAAGFLRIPKAKNPLDNSRVHPEQYKLVESMAKTLKVSIEELIGNESLINQIKPEDFVNNEIGLLSINDILQELKKKGLDPRKATKILEFDPDIRKLDDLKEGMILPGIITNVTNFGAFVDIGIKENGLIHVSQMANAFVDNPHDYVKLHQHLLVKVSSIDVERKRIQLSLKDLD